MKPHFIFTVLAVLAFIVATPKAIALFNHVQVERERRQEAEQRTVQAQQANGQLVHKTEQLHVVISVLSASVAVALVIGAAVGSKTRRDA